MAHIDIKVSVWQRIQIPDEVKISDVIEYFKNHDGTGSIDKIGIDASTYETLHDTETELTPEDNGGMSTVEILMDKDTIWSNQK